MASPLTQLDERDRADIDAGRHFDVAARLTAAGRPALAGWVYEQIWAFDEATAAYLAATAFVDALRCAVESGDGQLFDHVVDETVRVAPVDERRAAAELLQQRGRYVESSRLCASLDMVPRDQARALAAAGDRRAAAELLLAAGDAHGALDTLRLDTAAHSAAERMLAAQIAWDLGDTEGTARHAQAAFRSGVEPADAEKLSGLLARALSTLGYDLAAQLVLGGETPRDDHAPATKGRYLVTASMPTQYAGATYVGIDRVTLDEVELHLLLEARGPEEGRDPVVSDAIEQFFRTALAAAEIGHPAIRPVLRCEPDQALLVLPRAAGGTLHSMLHPPGPPHPPLRARNLVAFLLQGLAAAHARGLVHGQILPLHVVTDALGRPVLGPFGAHRLAGLAATQTGGLAEVLVFTAPERRRGGEPSSAADVFSIGIIFRALLAGNIEGRWSQPPPEVTSDDIALIDAMTAAAPSARPTAREALDRLGLRVADITELLDQRGTTRPSETETRPGPTSLIASLEVVAARGWTTDQLDAIASARCPWLQSVLDRDDNRFHLAAWPRGCARPGPDVAWRELAAGALDALGPELEALLAPRLDHDALVITPAGDCLIALDTVLVRSG